MAMTDLQRPASRGAGPTPAAPRAWWRRHPWVLALAGVLVLVGVLQLLERRGESRDRLPLETVERAAAASGEAVRTVRPALAERWGAVGGPAEEELLGYVGPGNRFLEPAFYADGGKPQAGVPEGGESRCYFLAVQPATWGSELDADHASSLIRACYIDGFRTPQSWSQRAVVD